MEAVDCLIRSQLVNMQQYDLHLAQSMENGLNYMAVAFAMQLVQRICTEDKHDQSNEVCRLCMGHCGNVMPTLAQVGLLKLALGCKSYLTLYYFVLECSE